MRLECGKTFLLRVYTLWLQLYLLVHLHLWDPAAQPIAIWVWVSASDRYIGTVSYVQIELPQCQ